MAASALFGEPETSACGQRVHRCFRRLPSERPRLGSWGAGDTHTHLHPHALFSISCIVILQHKWSKGYMLKRDQNVRKTWHIGCQKLTKTGNVMLPTVRLTPLASPLSWTVSVFIVPILSPFVDSHRRCLLAANWACDAEVSLVFLCLSLSLSLCIREIQIGIGENDLAWWCCEYESLRHVDCHLLREKHLRHKVEGFTFLRRSFCQKSLGIEGVSCALSIQKLKRPINDAKPRRYKARSALCQKWCNDSVHQSCLTMAGHLQAISGTVKLRDTISHVLSGAQRVSQPAWPFWAQKLQWPSRVQGISCRELAFWGVTDIGVAPLKSSERFSELEWEFYSEWQRMCWEALRTFPSPCALPLYSSASIFPSKQRLLDGAGNCCAIAPQDLGGCSHIIPQLARTSEHLCVSSPSP